MKEKLINFYSKHKKLVFIALAVIIVIVGFAIFRGGNDNKKHWNEVLLKEYLPEPKKGTIKMGSNLDDWLGFSIKNVKSGYYNEYKKECIDMGYTIESEESGNSYEAFNKDGYELSLSFYGNEISIILQAPEEMSELTWPTSGIGSKLPVPSSTYGKVSSDSTSTYRVLIGKMSKDEFNKYIQSCQDKGFNVDYNKQEETYSAKDKDGYRLNLQYVGNENVDILIQEPKSEENIDTEEPDDSESNNNSNTVDGMRKDFKNAMDSYEKFMNEYVDFMKKYTKNPADPSLLSDYTDYLSKYSKFVSDFEKWESDDMNTKEAAYYIEVQNRVNKKLLEIAN